MHVVHSVGFRATYLNEHMSPRERLTKRMDDWKGDLTFEFVECLETSLSMLMCC